MFVVFIQVMYSRPTSIYIQILLLKSAKLYSMQFYKIFIDYYNLQL